MKFAPQGAWNRWNGLIALLAISIVFVLTLGRRGEGPDAGQPRKDSPSAQAPRASVSDQATLRDTLDRLLAEQGKGRPEPNQEEDPAIAEHLDALESDLEPDEAAARLSALGNLYQLKKGDFKAAAGYYEILIERYPDWEGVLGVYRELVTCHEMLGDQLELRALYRKMLEKFPEDSDEYRAAREALDR